MDCLAPQRHRSSFSRECPMATLRKDSTRSSPAEYAAAVNLISQNLKAEAELFIPLKASRVRLLLVALNFGLGDELYVLPQWSQLAKHRQIERGFPSSATQHRGAD